MFHRSPKTGCCLVRVQDVQRAGAKKILRGRLVASFAYFSFGTHFPIHFVQTRRMLSPGAGFDWRVDAILQDIR